MRTSIFIGLAILFNSVSVLAQEGDTDELTVGIGNKKQVVQKDTLIPPKEGEITYIQEERISILDDYMKANPLKHDGYRIQLVFGSRDEVSRVKSRFLSQWNFSAYESYLQPNFRLRIGDFMTRIEAEKALQELKPHFQGAYVVQDKIEVPKQFR